MDQFMRMLIIDDDDLYGGALETLLELERVDCVRVRGLRAARWCLRAMPRDIILMAMPLRDAATRLALYELESCYPCIAVAVLAVCADELGDLQSHRNVVGQVLRTESPRHAMTSIRRCFDNRWQTLPVSRP